MTSDDLFRAFTHVVRLSLGVPLALAACSRIDTRGLAQPSCSSLGTPSVEGLTPVRPVNYIELRTGFGRGQEFALPDGGVNVISTTGSRCAGAASMTTCQTGLAALNSRSAFYELCGQICSGYQLATTEGDVVTLIDTPQGFRDFLGPIDTPQEAAWRVFTEGYFLACSDRAEDPTGVRAIDGGFEAVALKGSTCGRDTSLRQYLRGWALTARSSRSTKSSSKWETPTAWWAGGLRAWSSAGVAARVRRSPRTSRPRLRSRLRPSRRSS